LLHEAITRGELLEFKGFQVLKNEPRFHDSRFDLLLKDDETQIMVEAKSCTLVKGKVAQFPDAPTKRGSRHVQTLIEALEYGRAAVVFVIQRNDVAEFQPYHQNDPVFANSLIQAAEKGVEVYAYRCRVDLTSINIFDRIPAYIKPE
jgi:sugar fermentation stimulation protein A